MKNYLEHRVRKLKRTVEVTPSQFFEIPKPWSDLDAQLPEDYLFETPGLHARLDNSGNYVVCGAKGRGKRFATVHEDEVMELRYIQFLPGWAPQRDGAWAFSRHADLRNRRGLSVKGRRNPLDWIPAHNSVIDTGFHPLPTIAICPNRHLRNILTRRGLGVKLTLLKPPLPAPGRISHR